MAPTKENPIRYSIPILLILTVCLFLGEHMFPVEAHDIDVDSMVRGQSTNLMREVAYIVMGTAGLIGMHFTLVTRRVKLRWNRTVTVLLSLLLGLCALSILWSAVPATTGRRLCVIALIFLGAFGIAISWKRTQIVHFLAFSAAIQLAVGFAAELAYGYFTPWQADYRFDGTLRSNYEAQVCLVLIISSLCLARLNRRSRWFLHLLSGVGFIALLLTRSRGGLLASTSVLLLYLIVTLTLRQQILVAIGIGVLALIVVMSGTAPTLLTGLNRGGEGSDNINGRGPLWDELFTYIDKRPVLGYGYAGFWTIRRIDDLSSDQGWPMTGAHSGYVETLLAFGWTGAILHTLTLLICMAAGIRLFRRTGDYTSFLVAAFCLTYLIGGLTEGITIFYPCAISFYFTLLLCVLAVERERPNLEGTRPNAKESLQMD